MPASRQWPVDDDTIVANGGYALPCHAYRISRTCAYVKVNKVKPLLRYVDLKAYLDVIDNQNNAGVDDVKNVVDPALTRLWSASTPLSTVSAPRDFSYCLGHRRDDW